MVNLILVSHSYTLAVGVAELAEQMNNGCKIAVAAGMSDPENAIGTDAVKIMTAIEEVYSPDGVLVLMDLGSAILSAETALELIDPEMAANVKLCAAPLVEGTLAAVVSASAGADLATVAKEAEGALAAKLSQIGGQAETTESLDLPPVDALKFSWRVQNPHGLHARPTAKIVEVLSPFAARVWLESQGKWADAKSYNQLIKLQIRQGESVHFYFSGTDCEQAHHSLIALANAHFGEQIETSCPNHRIYGTPVAHHSEGQAVSFSQFFAFSQHALAEQSLAERQQQVAKALSQTQQQLVELSELPQLSPDFSGLFQAHQLLLDELSETIFEKLMELPAVEACISALEEVKSQYQQLDDPYLQARALDIDDLRHRILHNLLERPFVLPTLTNHSILVADELYPSTLVQLMDRPFQGICLQQGNPYSHTTLLAKSANIPLIIQCGDTLAKLANGDKLQVDWEKGVIQYE